jgi:hypothetical protein
MGSNFSYEAPSPKSQLVDNEVISSFTSTQRTDLNDVEYIYLVNYNDDFYFTRNNEEIIDIITSVKQQYVDLALKNWNIYNYHIYEKVYNKYQKLNLEDNKIEEILKPSNLSESNKQMQEVYSLDVCKSIKHIILHVETNLEKLRVYRVYNLSNIFEVESDSEEDIKDSESEEQSKEDDSKIESKEEDNEAEVISENVVDNNILETKKNL